MHWFLDPIKNHYFDFEGRTGRQAFWMFILISFLISIAVNIATKAVGLEALSGLYSLAVLLPSLGITARRLHDIGKSGWWQLIGIIPIIGWIILIVWCATKSDPAANMYGAAPAGAAAMATPDATAQPMATSGSPEESQM